MVDIDHFKRINDSHGHRTGDLVLAAVSEQIRGLLRDADIAGRLGGEEFAVMLPETGLGGAILVAERLRQQSRPRPSISATADRASAPCRSAWPAWTIRRRTWKTAAPRRYGALQRQERRPQQGRQLRDRSSGVRKQPEAQRDQRQRPPF